MHSQLQPRSHTLERWWKPATLLAWIVFIAYEIGIGLDKLYSEHPLCPYSDHDFSFKYWAMCYASLGGFIICDLFLAFKIFQIEISWQRVPMWLAFHVVTIGITSTVLSVVFGWGGLCIDTIGFSSPASMWGEWLTSGPLLIFITVSLADKDNMGWIDVFIIFSFFVCIFTAWLIIIPQSHGSAAFLLTLSFVAYIPVIYLPYHCWPPKHEKLLDMYPNAFTELTILKQRHKQQFQLALWLSAMFPVFPLLYLLSIWGVLSTDSGIIALHVFSMLTKGFWAAAAINIHLELSLEMERIIIEEIRANESRRAFVKYIFHEVRTPLSSLTMGVDLLKLSPNIDAKDRESLELMSEGAKFMSKTLSVVLNIHKIEEGKFDLELSPTSFAKIVRNVTSSLTAEANKRQNNIIANVSPKVPYLVSIDGFRIEHVLMNLLSNAIKFSPHGEDIFVNVDCISTLKSDKDSTEVSTIVISVKDFGEGISAENQQYLFRNFSQIRPGTLQKGQGSGLGLSFCKKIVNLHGGVIEVQSNLHEGSTFKITMPCPVISWQPSEKMITSSDEFSSRTDDDKVSDKQPLLSQSNLTSEGKAVLPSPSHDTVPLSIPQSEASDSLSLQSIEVLCVDDSAPNRKILQMLLRRKGIKTSEAVDGEAAVKLVSQDLDRFKLILIDNLMPSLNGVDATKSLRALGFPYLIFGVTGNVTEDDIEDFQGLGANCVLFKPLNLVVIEKVLRFISQFGVISKPDMVIKENINGEFEWVSKLKSGDCAINIDNNITLPSESLHVL